MHSAKRPVNMSTRARRHRSASARVGMFASRCLLGQLSKNHVLLHLERSDWFCIIPRRTPRLFARPMAIRRRGTTARPIPAASAPLVANPFGTPSAGDTSVVLLLDRGFRLPASVAHERPLDSGSERIEEELRHLVESLVHVLDGAPAGSASPRGISARVFHAIVLLFTVLSLSFGWLCNRVLYSVRRRNGQRFRIRSHQAFSGGGRRESCE